jgi:hypothetical protein
MCQIEVVAELQSREPSMDKITRIFIDTSKSVFQRHGVNAAEAAVLRRKLSRSQMVTFFAKLAPTVIAMEACGSAHHWARVLIGLGHEVKLIAPQHVKPYVKRNKNDARDAEAGCEAMSRPTMSFVPVKSAEDQAALMLMGVREALVNSRTQLSNAIRGHAAEFGLVVARGLDKIEPLLADIAADERLPALARELFALQGEAHAQLQARIEQTEARLKTCRRLAKVPSIGPGRLGPAGDEDAQCGGLQVGPPLRSLDRADAEGSFHRRKTEAGRDHPGRRRGLAKHPGGRRRLRHPAGSERSGAALALAGAAADPQATQAGGGGPGQQSRAHRLEDDAHRRRL